MEIVWQDQNNIIQERNKRRVNDMICRLQTNLQTFLGAVLHNSLSSPTLVQWTPPPFLWIKVNVDIFIHPLFSVEVSIARNDQPNFLTLQAEHFTCIDLLVREALVLLGGIKLATTKGWRYVVFKSNCKEFSIAILATNTHHWSISFILKEVHSLLSYFKC